MPILDKREIDFILKVESGEKKRGQLMVAGILGTVIALFQATKDILAGFTKYKLVDTQTLALENATFWIFLLIYFVLVRNDKKRYIRIIRKLMTALESPKNDDATKE
jgi:hypothetical protein